MPICNENVQFSAKKLLLPSFEETRRRLGTVLKLFKLLLGAV